MSLTRVGLMMLMVDFLVVQDVYVEVEVKVKVQEDKLNGVR